MFRRLPAAVVAVLVAASATLTGPVRGSEPPAPIPTADWVSRREALSCPDGYRHPARPVVLLVHGTATTAEESWPSGFGRVLPAAGFDWCTVQLPQRALGDIQVAAEYVVTAVRLIREQTGRKVSVIGHSQGALEPRWAMRFWPDVRNTIEDYISLAGSNQGVATANCDAGPCPPAVWQQRIGSAFLAALNQGPLPAGPSYTAVFSVNDELIQPWPRSMLPGASNVLIQEVCPGRPVHHIQFLFDAAVVATVLDALSHDGPAQLDRIDRRSCARDVPPEIDRTQAWTGDATLYTNAFVAFAGAERTDAEPPVRDYAR